MQRVQDDALDPEAEADQGRSPLHLNHIGACVGFVFLRVSSPFPFLHMFLCVCHFFSGASPVFEKAQISARSSKTEEMAAPAPSTTEPENVELPAIQVQHNCRYSKYIYI